MKIKEIMELVKSNSIEFDANGHSCNLNIKYLIEHYNEHVDGANGVYDNTWSVKDGESIEKINEDMRKFYISRLNSDEESLRFFLRDFKCFKCGKSIYAGYNEGKLKFYNGYYGDGEFLKRPFIVDYSECSFKTIKPFECNINIKDEMVISNYFGLDDTPEGEKYEDEYSLNAVSGRYKIAKFKSENQNTAYAQMGNMGIGIYINKNKDSIIIGPSYHPAELEEYSSNSAYKEAIKKPIFEGYKKINSNIILDVWRYEITNSDILKKECPSDVTKIKVKKGCWKFTNYYEINRYQEKENYLYAKLELIKD